MTQKTVLCPCFTRPSAVLGGPQTRGKSAAQTRNKVSATAAIWGHNASQKTGLIKQLNSVSFILVLIYTVL